MNANVNACVLQDEPIDYIPVSGEFEEYDGAGVQPDRLASKWWYNHIGLVRAAIVIAVIIGICILCIFCAMIQDWTDDHKEDHREVEAANYRGFEDP